MLMEDAEHVARLLSELGPLEELEVDSQNKVGLVERNSISLLR
jgi:hypothetical protein